MLLRKGNDIYIKNVQPPNNLEILVTSIMYNNLKLESDKFNIKRSAVCTLNLDPSKFINKSSSIISDAKDYIASVLEKLIRECYFDKNNQNDVTSIMNLQTFLSIEYGSNVAKAFHELIYNTRNALDDPDVELGLNESNDFHLIFSATIGKINFSFDRNVTNSVYGSEFDMFTCLFNTSKLEGRINSYSNTNKIRARNQDKRIDVCDLMSILTQIFLFYAFQDRRNELMSSQFASISQHYNKRGSESGEVYMWDNNLDCYMSYYPKIPNKFLISTLNQSITVPHIMTEGYEELDDELRYRGGERYNPTEFKKIKYIQEKGVANNITFITMPNKTLGRFDKHFDDISNYIAYRAYENNGKSIDSIAIHLYTSHKNRDMNYNINQLIHMPKVPIESLGNVSYDDLFFNSLEHDLTNPEIEFKCNVAYFSKGGGRTFKSYSDLKTTKIPKEKRDHIFTALCDLCYELDIEPQKIIDRLDVDFKRYYKSPTELE